MMEPGQEIDTKAIADRLDDVRERIEHACRRAGRRPEEITLVAVSKKFPIDVVAAGYELGLRHFAENRMRELVDKVESMPGVHRGGDLRWHMIGHLQRNKAKKAVEYADCFQALDSPRLAKEIEKRAGRIERTFPCLVQVNISGQDRKYGITPEDTHAFLDRLAAYEYLHVGGLMAMATFADDPEEVRGEFRRMRKLFDTYDTNEHPTADLKHLSLGMSNDFEVAIEEGATMIRLGSALFGPRG